MKAPTPVQKLADAARKLLIGHVRANTTEDDACREAERDARVRATIEALGREGKLPPPAAREVEPAVSGESGADPAVVAWVPGEDIRGLRHLLRIVADYRPANTYDTEDVWVVQVDPPCPVWQPEIVLRDEPRTIGPWPSADRVLVCSVEREYVHLDLAAASRHALGQGVPTPDGRRFARVAWPDGDSARLEILDTLTGNVDRAMDVPGLPPPVAFDRAGRVLTCGRDGRVVRIDVVAGTIMDEPAPSPAGDGR